MAHPVINSAKCTGDGSCVDSCPKDAFALEGGKCVVKRSVECGSCRRCVPVCPEGAITILN